MLFLNKIFTFIFWLLILVFINYFSPDSSLIITAFFTLLFCAIFCSIHLFIVSLRKSLILAMFLTALILLQYFHQTSILNLILLATLSFLVFRLFT